MRGIIIFILTLYIAIPSFGLTLDQAVSKALERNPEILAAQKSWEAHKAKIASVSTWPDPQLELMYEQIPQSGGSINDAQMKMYGISQMIPFPGKLTVKRGIVEAAARISEEKYRAKSQEIIAKVKSAYYTLFLIDKSIQINQENQDLLTSFARIAEAKYVVGKATQHDVLKAKIELSLLSNELITLEQRRQTAQARLNMLLNRKNDVAILVINYVEVPKLIYTQAELEKIALINRPELKAGKFSLERRETVHFLAKLQYLPDFKIKLLQREMRTTGLNGWNFSLMADLPIWFWRKTSVVDSSGKEREQAKAKYENLSNKVRFEVQDAYVMVDSAKRLSILFKDKIIPQAKQALRSATIAYESDKVDFLTLINSQKTLEQSRLKYFQAFAELGKSLAELERVIAPRQSSGQGGFNNEK